MQDLPASATIGYLRIDAQPMKQALSTTVSKWIYSFTTYIQNRVRCYHCSLHVQGKLKMQHSVLLEKHGNHSQPSRLGSIQRPHDDQQCANWATGEPDAFDM